MDDAHGNYSVVFSGGPADGGEQLVDRHVDVIHHKLRLKPRFSNATDGGLIEDPNPVYLETEYFDTGRTSERGSRIYAIAGLL